MLYFKNHLYAQGDLYFLMPSSRSFIVLCFTFRSVIHFELIFVTDVRTVSRFIFILHVDIQSFRLPRWCTSGKEPSATEGDIGDAGLIPGLGRSPGGGHGNPLQYSCFENPMARGAWRAAG